jgi:carotenoid cleavage dioxygenase-like enzyme
MGFDCLAHIDVHSGRKQIYAFPAGDMTGEPVFVPRGVAEGDGWLLSVVWRGNRDRSDIAVFDAQDVARGPIGVASLPRRVPFGFHGNWVAQ